MGSIMDVVAWLIANGPHLVSAVVGVLTALIALFMLIPGEQPEKFLQQCVDFIEKYSLK